MVSVSNRSMLLPGIAAATVGALVLSPSLVAPPAAMPVRAEVQIPVVHIQDIQLAGIGQDIYAGINRWVVFGVQAVQGLLWWVPIVGAPIYSQLGVVYFKGIQPLVEATVNALASVVQNPLNLIGDISAYVGALSSTAYTFISAEASWLGLPGLPPQLPFASVGGSSAPVAAARSTGGARAAASEVSASVSLGRVGPRRAARIAAVDARHASATADSPAGAVHSIGRASRSAKAPRAAAEKAVANAAS
jgi:hypothetical protein